MPQSAPRVRRDVIPRKVFHSNFALFRPRRYLTTLHLPERLRELLATSKEEQRPGMEAYDPSIFHQAGLLVFVLGSPSPFKHSKIKSTAQRCATTASQSQGFLNLFTP